MIKWFKKWRQKRWMTKHNKKKCCMAYCWNEVPAAKHRRYCNDCRIRYGEKFGLVCSICNFADSTIQVNLTSYCDGCYDIECEAEGKNWAKEEKIRKIMHDVYVEWTEPDLEDFIDAFKKNGVIK